MTRIVTTTYRYKSPPRKRKAVALEAPAIVTAKSSRRPQSGERERRRRPRLRSRPPSRRRGSVLNQAHRTRQNESHQPTMVTKPAIVTAGRKRRSVDGPHLPMELPLSRKPVERDGDDYKARSNGTPKSVA